MAQTHPRPGAMCRRRSTSPSERGIRASQVATLSSGRLAKSPQDPSSKRLHSPVHHFITTVHAGEPMLRATVSTTRSLTRCQQECRFLFTEACRSGLGRVDILHVGACQGALQVMCRLLEDSSAELLCPKVLVQDLSRRIPCFRTSGNTV